MSSQNDARQLSGKSANNNALTRGGTAQKIILPGENPVDFEVLFAGLRSEYQSETAQQQLFIEQLAMAHWFLWRRQRAYNAIESAAYESAGDEPENLSEEQWPDKIVGRPIPKELRDNAIADAEAHWKRISSVE